MDVEHDSDGVSIDLSIAEAIDLCAFIETIHAKEGVAELHGRLKEIFGGWKKFTERVNHIRRANGGSLRFVEPAIIWKNGRNEPNKPMKAVEQ